MERLTHKARNTAGYKANKDVRRWECIDKLGELEDLEQEGLLLRLPCELGQTVWVLAECKNVQSVLDGSWQDATGYYCPYELYDNCPHTCDECDEVQEKTAVFEDSISYIGYNETGILLFTENTGICGDIGRDIFLTKEAAEKALAEREA